MNAWKKALGLMLAMVLVAAIGTSSATAAEFRSPSATTNVTVTPINETAFGSTAMGKLGSGPINFLAVRMIG